MSNPNENPEEPNTDDVTDEVIGDDALDGVSGGAEARTNRPAPNADMQITTLNVDPAPGPSIAAVPTVNIPATPSRVVDKK